MFVCLFVFWVFGVDSPVPINVPSASAECFVDSIWCFSFLVVVVVVAVVVVVFVEETNGQNATRITKS